MITTRTPFRVSFFGGSTDYPVYFREHGGVVVSTTINHYCYIMCRLLPPFFDYKYRIRYAKTEYVKELSEIMHPSVRACLQYLQIPAGVEMIHSSDIPAMSGVGSSSAFTVGWLKALHALKGNIISKKNLALQAIEIERDILNENVGSQDQIATAFGGFNRIEFYPDGGFYVEPLTIKSERIKQLQDNLLFFFTGFSRRADDIAKEQIRETRNKLCVLHEMKALVDESINVLNSEGDLAEFGRMLDISWKLKKSITDVISNPELDEIYDVAMKAGCVGGKLCGAGGGGFFLFYAPKERHPAIKAALKGLLCIPLRFETMGAHIAFYSDPPFIPDDQG